MFEFKTMVGKLLQQKLTAGATPDSSLGRVSNVMRDGMGQPLVRLR
jgi:hypothetical protein